MSSSELLHTFTVTTDPDAQVVIFDGYDCVKQRGIGSASWDLPSGLYTIRAQLGGQQVQRMINVPETTSISLVPQLYSPAPIDGVATTHEYYHDPAQNWSNKSTIPSPTLGSGGWLFIFVRLSSEKSACDGDIMQGLSICDSKGKLILDLSDQQLTRRDDRTGWALVSASINPGFYRIRFDGTEKRESSLYVYPNFSTQIFVTYFHSPRLEQMRAFLRPLGQPFVASDLEARSVEFALLGLQNGISSLAQTLQRNDQRALLDGKFTNPMLGLIGAHWLLEDSSAQLPFVSLVLTNLKSLLGPVPDVIALEVAAAKRFEMPTPTVTPILTPPFIRRGLEILVKERPDLIPSRGFIESIVENLYFDSPWSSWHATSQFQSRLSTEYALATLTETSLDWMESAVLNAGLRGEFDEKSTDALAKKLLVTPTLIVDANSRLVATLQGRSLAVSFNEDYLAEGQNPAVVLNIDDWATRGAALFNLPIPTGFTEARGSIVSGRGVAFRGTAGDVYLQISGESQFVIVSWRLLPVHLDRWFGDLKALIPIFRQRTSALFMISCGYHEDTPRGAVALSSVGPRSKPESPQFSVISAATPGCGLRDSIQQFLRDFGLPRQVAKASEVSHPVLQFGHVEGSFRFKFDSEIRFAFLGQDEDQKRWQFSPEVAHPLVGSGVLTASGVFQFGFVRDPKGAIKFTIHRGAQSQYSPIYLAEFRVGSFQWLEWLREAAALTRLSNEALARALMGMADTFATRIRERAFYHWLDNRSLQDDSWYQAEATETQDVATAFNRVLVRQYATSLRNLLEQGPSGTPLVEIQIDTNDNIDLLEQAMNGSFNLRDKRQGVSLSGALVSLAGERQTCAMLLGAGRPNTLMDDGDRVAAVDALFDSPQTALARIQAAVAAGPSAAATVSSPSAVLTSFFSGASSDLLRTTLTPLVQRWLPREQQNWQSIVSSIGTQAGAYQWNAINQLKLRWAIDIRQAGGDAGVGPELIHPVLRRELRLLLPFFFFDDIKKFLDFKQAIPVLVYQLLPPSLSSVADLETNYDLSSRLEESILQLKQAFLCLNIDKPDSAWYPQSWTATAASSWLLKMLLTWEEHVNEVVTRGLFQIYRSPKARAATLDQLAVEIVDALSALPMLADKPRAISSLWSVVFTTALSLAASVSANVSTELSITAFDSRIGHGSQWVDSPDSVPLEAIIAHGHLTAMAEGWSPAALTARRAMAAR